MSTTDQELEVLRDSAEDGQLKELLNELIQARKALVVAKKLSQLGSLLEISLFTMQMQEAVLLDELYLGILHKKADGSGRVGPSWPIDEFHQDLKKLGDLLLSDDQKMELKASMIAQIVKGGK
jgi:hypothetical protein